MGWNSLVFDEWQMEKCLKNVSKKSDICAILFGATCSAEIIHYLNNHSGKFIE